MDEAEKADKIIVNEDSGTIEAFGEASATDEKNQILKSDNLISSCPENFRFWLKSTSTSELIFFFTPPKFSRPSTVAFFPLNFTLFEVNVISGCSTALV